MHPAHLHNAEGNSTDGFTTISEAVVAERIIYPADDAGGVDYQAKVAVGREALEDDEL